MFVYNFVSTIFKLRLDLVLFTFLLRWDFFCFLFVYNLFLIEIRLGFVYNFSKIKVVFYYFVFCISNLENCLLTKKLVACSIQILLRQPFLITWDETTADQNMTRIVANTGDTCGPSFKCQSRIFSIRINIRSLTWQSSIIE